MGLFLIYLFNITAVLIINGYVMENMYEVVIYSKKTVLLTSCRKDAMRKFFILSYKHIPCKVYKHFVSTNASKVVAETLFD